MARYFHEPQAPHLVPKSKSFCLDVAVQRCRTILRGGDGEKGMKRDGWINGDIDGWMDGWMDGWIEKREREIDR
jgi:hypothetical protein